MHIIKPYGRTIVETEKNRQIARNPGAWKNREIESGDSAAVLQDIAELMQDDRLIIAQWIAIIDKIIVKPFEKDKKGKKESESAALQNAKKYRKWLGDAAWEMLKSDYLLSVFRDGAYGTEEKCEKDKQWLKALWDKKNQCSAEG